MKPVSLDQKALNLLERLKTAETERGYSFILQSMEKFLKQNSFKLQRDTRSKCARRMFMIVSDDLIARDKQCKAIDIIVAVGGPEARSCIKGLMKSEWARGLEVELNEALRKASPGGLDVTS